MTTPKERPILFSGEMVKAILAGRKTQTRRVAKLTERWNHQAITRWEPRNNGRWNAFGFPGEKEQLVLGNWPCPYGSFLDRLWVRETWAPISPDEYWRPIKECNVEYRADTPNALYPGGWPEDEAKGNDEAPKWKPSIFMPRWASRITLEVTGLRVQRLRCISEADAMAEGVIIPEHKRGTVRLHGLAPVLRTSYASEFASLWDSINAKRGYSWESNPWVWAIEFKRVETCN